VKAYWRKISVRIGGLVAFSQTGLCATVSRNVTVAAEASPDRQA